MSNKFPTQDIIIEAILSGIVNAARNFLFWTNSRLSLSSGPQKIITIQVANAIASLHNAPEIFIDATISDILRCSLEDRGAYLEFMRKSSIKQGTFDITLDERFEHQNNNDSISKVIISIQNGVINVKPQYTLEIEKICKMLDRRYEKNSSLDYGVFAFYADISPDARKKLNKRVDQIIKSFDMIVEKYSQLHSKYISSETIYEKDGSQWCAGCYIIEPKNR